MRNYKVLPLGEILSDEYNQDSIQSAFKKFSCHREHDIEDFLIRKAIPYEKTNYGKTYIFIDEDELNNGNLIVLAYFTIAVKSLEIKELSQKKKRKLLGAYPGRDGLNSVPAFLIGQLGRNDICEKDSLDGQHVLDECYYAISLASKVVGGNLIMLECRECMYEKFYAKQGFKKLYDELNEDGLYTLYKKIDFTEYWKNK